MIALILAGSFTISTALSLWILRARHKKWLGLLASLGANTLVLGLAWYLYEFDEETRLFGVDATGHNTLILFIPFLLWLQFMLLTFLKSRRHNT